MRSPHVALIHVQSGCELSFEALGNALHLLQSLTLDNQGRGPKNLLLQCFICEKIAGSGGKQLGLAGVGGYALLSTR